MVIIDGISVLIPRTFNSQVFYLHWKEEKSMYDSDWERRAAGKARSVFSVTSQEVTMEMIMVL